MTATSLTHSTVVGALTIALGLSACGENPKPAAVPTAATTTTATTTAAPPKDDVKIMKEFWDTGKIKFYNEMRKDADGKWDRNGLGRAYFSSGLLEREGQYKNGKRIGVWIYFNPEGLETRRENRGDGAMPDAH
jgi:hypothetical protein